MYNNTLPDTENSGFVKGTTVKVTLPETFNAGNTKETAVNAGKADKMAAGTDKPATRIDIGLLINGKLLIDRTMLGVSKVETESGTTDASEVTAGK